MEFPRKRFERVGASQSELDEMEAEFDASSEAAQRSLVDRIAPLPDAAIEDLLEKRRESEQAPESEPEPAASQPAAAATASASASAPAKASQADSSQQSSS